MTNFTRRDFVAGTTGIAAASTIGGRRARGANDDVRVAIVGVGNKGNQHTGVFKGLDGVRVVGLCDPDSARLDTAAQKHFGGDVTLHRDLREVLDRKDVDAICVATPNHWHALATVWACQAGKDVYVEKPCSHTIWEGRQMIAAADTHKRIVQVGTQRRSDPGWSEVIERLHGGELGRIERVRIIFYRRRDGIGLVREPQQPPKTVDYNLWAGPAPASPIMRKQFHYDWHWFWSTGNGELGNNGPHILDLARWIIGAGALPERVLSLGDRYVWDDNGTTPNTHAVLYDYKPAPVLIEIRNLSANPDTTTSDHYQGVRSGLIVECEHGSFRGLVGGAFYDRDDKVIRKFTGDGGGGHQANFIAAMRSRRIEDLACPITEGHLSTALCLIGNISHRVGASTTIAEAKDRVAGDPLLADATARITEHLVRHGCDPASDKIVLGAHLKIDPQQQRFVDCPEAEAANRLLRGTYRKPFVINDTV